MATAPRKEPTILTVSALTTRIKSTLEGQFPAVWVSGELSNVTRAASGHMYFTLKDAKAQLKAAMFRGVNLRLRFEPRDGMEVLARGRIGLYDQRGEYQLYVEELQPKGIGAAELALRQLKEKLLAKGYFDPRRKRPLPRFPRRVALIASPTGAAIRDMIELLAQRWPLSEVIVQPSRVQGDGAAAEVAAALNGLNRLHVERRLKLDAIIIGRGGGSTEDLWAFNEETVADAIFQSVVPVVSAVGHEIDVTIADLVADHRAETPSAAVVALTPNREEILRDLRNMHRQARDAMVQRLTIARRTVGDFASRPVLRRPVQKIRDLEQRLDDLSGRLHRACRVRVNTAKEKVDALSGHLETLSPLNVLNRGYSLTLSVDGRLIRSAGSVQSGDELVTRLASGEIISRVERTVDRI